MRLNFVYNINELTLIPFFISILAGKKVYVLSIEPLFPPLQRFLERLVERQIQTGRVQYLMDICPELHHVRSYKVSLLYYNIFRDTLDWHEEFFGFQEAEIHNPDYSYAINLTTVNYTAPKQLQILLIKEAESVLPEDSVKIVGVLPDTIKMFEAYYKRLPKCSIRILRYPRSLLNIFISAGTTIFSVGWLLSRLRPFFRARKRYFLAVDFYGDVRDIELAKELKIGGPILIVVVIKYYLEQFREQLADFDIISSNLGRLNIRNGVIAIGMIFLHGWKLLRKYYARESSLFYKIITLPHRRARIRTQVATYPTDYYWGRDIYNPEHIIRRQELKRVGGKTYTFLSGYGVLGDVAETLSYMSFDKLYIMGRAFKKKYERTWATDMDVVPIGSYGLTPGKIAALKNRKEKPKDIVIFTSYVPLFDHPKLKSFIREIAATFSDRTIFLQLKSFFHEDEIAIKFINDCTEGFDNVEYTPLFLEDLIDRVGYAFSDPATIIMETIQFSIPSFVIDVVEKHDYCIYREYPYLCQNEPKEAIRLIRGIEDGTWTYPFESYRDLVETPDISIFEQIKKDMKVSPTIG